MRKFTFKSLLITAALCLGTSAWAQETTIYERGTTTAWSDVDLAEGAWNVSISDGSYPCSPVIDETLGLSLPGCPRNQEVKNSTQIVPTANSILTIDAVWNVGGPTGKSGNTTYFKIGNQIEFFAMPQDQKGGVIVNGTTHTFSNACSKNNNNRTDDVWTINVVINTATNVITALNVSGQNGNTKVSVALTDLSLGSDAIFNTLSLGCVRQANNMYTSLKSIKISEEKQTVSTANYTVKYVCGETELNVETRIGVVEESIDILSDIKPYWKDGVKYIYVSDDSSDQTIAEDGSTVVTVIFREANTYSYKVNATDGTNVIEVIKEGSNFEGETINYAYSSYVNNEGTLYTRGANNMQYNNSFTLTEDNQVINLEYSATEISSVVYFIEAEKLPDAAILTENNANIRCSNSAAGRASEGDITMTSLNKGTYKLVAQIFSPQSAGGDITFKTSDARVRFKTGNSNTTLVEKEFVVVEDGTDVLLAQGGGNRNGVDFVYIIKVNSEVPTTTIEVGENGVATWCPLNSVDFSSSTLLKAYKASVSGSIVTLTNVTFVAAGEGVIIKSVSGETASEELPKASGVTASADNALTGTLIDIDALATDVTKDEAVVAKNYILNNGTQGIGFYQAAGNKVAAGKAYLQVPVETVAEAKALTIVWNDGETTGIKDNYEFGIMNSDAATFDLSGRKVANPAKGLYIKNGKKFIVK